MGVTDGRRDDKSIGTLTTVQTDNMVAEPVGDSGGKSCAPVAERVGSFNGSQSGHIYNGDGAKARTLQAGGGGCGDTSSAKTGLYAHRVGQIGNGQAERICGTDGKSVGLKANGGGAKTGLYAVPGKQYTVKNGQITIKGKTYPIKLADGNYIIRKLSVGECRRLQTVPEWVEMENVVKSTRCYQMLGNGRTIDVIKHIINSIPNIYNEEVEVLSLYDGMSCGMIALIELGINVKRYMAYEIDPYAIKVSKHNFPEIIHLGDASGVDWHEW